MPKYSELDYEDFKEELLQALLRNESLQERTIFRNYAQSQEEDQTWDYLHRMLGEGLIHRKHWFPETRFERINYTLTRHGLREVKRLGLSKLEDWADFAIESYQEEE